MAADATQNTLCHMRQGGDRLEVASGGSIVADSGSSVTFSGTTIINGIATLQTTSPTIPIGYATGAGGAVTQLTNRSTGVTVTTNCGTITTDTTSLAAGAEAAFAVTATGLVSATSLVVVNAASGQTANTSIPVVTGVAANSFTITLTNLHASTADTGAMVINYAIIKSVAA